VTGGYLCVAYAATWEPIPDDGIERFDEARPRPYF
jgi:hypothetical protein